MTHNEKLIHLEERNVCAQDFRSSEMLMSGAFHEENAEAGHDLYSVSLALIHILCDSDG